jgi:hypothetical protein
MSTSNFYELEKKGWSWSSGWSITRGGYYAQIFKDLPKPKRIDGQIVFRNVITEFGRTLEEAESKVLQRYRRITGEEHGST